MKICFLSCEYGPTIAGGEGVVTQSLAEGLAAAGHEVRVAGLRDRHVRSPIWEERSGVSIHRIPVPRFRGGGVWARYRLWRLVRGWAMSGAVDLVDAPLSRGLVAGWGRLPVPVIVRIHGSHGVCMSPTAPPPSPLSRWFERKGAERADALCAVGSSVARLVTERLLDRSRPCAVIPNPVSGLDAPDWSPEPPATVVYSGGLIERKGICELIRVWPRVRLRLPEARLLLFGRDSVLRTGEMASRWIAKQLRNPEDHGVEIRGQVPREALARAYARAAAVVLPSHYEAFGMAAAEAMWCGCPLVFTRCGSGPELLRDGEEGLLVDPRDPDCIADALLRLLLDPEFAARLGRAAAAKAQARYALAPVLQLNLDFYAKCRRELGAGHA